MTLEDKERERQLVSIRNECRNAKKNIRDEKECEEQAKYKTEKIMKMIP